MSAKAKKKPTMPPALMPVVIAVPVPAASGPPPAFMPVEIAAPVPAASGPLTVTLAYARWSVTTVAMGPLAREIAALPLSRLVPLKDAAKLASDRLGSYELAAQDLAQRARTRQLTIVAQVVGCDKRVFILRPEFWRWYKVVWARPRPEDGRPEVFIGVNPVRDNPVRRAVGEWDFFVGRRRLERLYSAVSSDKQGSTTGSRPVLRQQTGPKTARRWQDHVLREQYRAAAEGRPLLTGSELANSCEEHLGVTVDVSDINKFLKRAREEL